MKICVPTMGGGGLDEQVCEHFGKAPTYTIVDTDTSDLKVIENTSEHMGGVGKPPDLILSAGADTIVVSGLGQKAVARFEALGIVVHIGAGGTVRDAIRALGEGALPRASSANVCREHQGH